MKNKPFMYLVGYDRTFQKNCNTGFGCGYVAIPVEHPIAVKHFERLKADTETEANTPDDQWFYLNTYLEIDFGQEITYTETTNIDGHDYLVAGFDTAHSWNDKTHDFNYVFRETMELLNIIETHNENT